MGFGFENTRHRETEPVSDQAANRERLFEAEHTAEDFDDCVPEVKERTADKMEALQEAEDDFNDCEAKLNELREENPELEDPDDFSDCAKETDDRYVAEVTYTTDGEISEQEAAEQMQEAYRENDDPEDMGQLKENINENEHIQAIDAKVVERPAVQPEEQAAYQEASEAYEQSKENLEEQRAAVEEVRQELDNEGAQSSEEREGAMEPAEAAPENAEPIEPDEAEAEEQTQELPDGREEPALEAQETQETREAQEIQEERETQEAQAAQEAQESKEVQEPQEGQQAQEVQPLMEPQPAQEARLDAVTPSEPHEDVQDVQERAQEFSPLEQRAPEDQRDDAGIQPQREGDFALEESASDAGYPESREVQDPAEGLDAQIEKALGDDDITIAEVQALAQKNAAVLQDAMTERNRTDAQLQETFQLALTKPYGTDEYKATLQEYNALKDRKEQMDASIASLNKLQDQLRQKSAELCDVQIRRGEAAFEASAATVVAAQALEGQFDDVFYKRKPDKKALQSLTEQNTAAIDSLRSERDAIKLAMDGKMHELSQYITSHNMGRFDAENNSYCRRLSEEYRALEAAYGRADYHIVKLDENNISMAETLGKPYDSVQRARRGRPWERKNAFIPSGR